MIVVCWSVKGGSGVTVVAAALATLASRQHPTVLVDLAGDALAALGLPETAGVEFPSTPDDVGAFADAVSSATTCLDERLEVVSVRSRETAPAPAWSALTGVLSAQGRTVVIDAGSHREPPAPLRLAADVDVLVIRSCYLALRRAAAIAMAPTAAVVVAEPGRALGSSEVAQVLRVPVMAELEWDPSVARLVDAGLLGSRLHPRLSDPLAPLIENRGDQRR